MTPDELRETVRSKRATELSRLGSSKALYAATDGEIDAERVLRAAADAERAAAETFAAWADDEPDATAREAFAETAAEEEDHFERVREELDGYEPSDDVPALAAHLRGLDDTVERAGAFLGRVLVADGSKSQYVGYFVGNADPATASVFRELRADLDGQETRALDVLKAVCVDDADWERAEAAALETIRVAYDEHVATLEDLGVDPKPVC